MAALFRRPDDAARPNNVSNRRRVRVDDVERLQVGGNRLKSINGKTLFDICDEQIEIVGASNTEWGPLPGGGFANVCELKDVAGVSENGAGAR
jgi:hypothetical protein